MRSPILLALVIGLTATPAAAQHTRLVRAAQLADSVRLDSLLHARAAAGARGNVVLSIAIDSTGTATAVRVFSGDLSEADLQLFTDSAPALLRPQARTDDRWWIRLVLHVGPAPSFRTQRSQEEAPRLVNPEALAEEIEKGEARPRSAANGMADLRILVGSDGAVRDINTHFSTLPLPAPTLQHLRQRLRFVAGKVDDRAETLWTELRYIAGSGGVR